MCSGRKQKSLHPKGIGLSQMSTEALPQLLRQRLLRLLFQLRQQPLSCTEEEQSGAYLMLCVCKSVLYASMRMCLA
jgi:hypothetical protein